MDIGLFALFPSFIRWQKGVARDVIKTDSRQGVITQRDNIEHHGESNRTDFYAMVASQEKGVNTLTRPRFPSDVSDVNGSAAIRDDEERRGPAQHEKPENPRVSNSDCEEGMEREREITQATSIPLL